MYLLLGLLQSITISVKRKAPRWMTMMPDELLLCVGARVLTDNLSNTNVEGKNVWQPMGLYNGSLGIIKALLVTDSVQQPVLPM